MKKVILNLIGLLILIGMVVTSICSVLIISKGYNMYKTAVSETNIEDAINKVKSEENYVKIENISDEFIQKVLKSEDKRFYYHFGFDIIATTRAMYNNIKARAFVQGGSTITQQLAKNLYFTTQKKLERKVAELFVAFKLESRLTKNEILELYCNIAYFGENCYGLKEAANHYYGIEADQLSAEQASALVFTIKCPNLYNPHAYKSLAA